MPVQSPKLLAKILKLSGVPGRVSARLSKRVLVGPEYYLGEGLESFHIQKDILQSDFVESYEETVRVVGVDHQIQQRMRLLAWAGKYAAIKNPDGLFVELGTGRGFSMYFLNTYLRKFGVVPTFKLFDSFQPDLTEQAKGQGAFSAGRQYYAGNFLAVKLMFARWPEIELIQGWLPSSMCELDPRDISLLHIDLNDGNAEAACLEGLWDGLKSGTVVVLDDFSNRGRNSQRQIVDFFFESKSVPVLSTPQGQGLVIVP